MSGFIEKSDGVYPAAGLQFNPSTTTQDVDNNENNNNNDQSSSNAVLADLSAGDHGIGNGPEDGGGPSSLLPRTAKWRQIPQMSGEGIAVHRFCHVGAVYNGECGVVCV